MRNSFSFLTLFIGLFLGIAISIWSFSEPSDNPPNCAISTPGCNEPLNASASAQTKSGDITVNNLVLGGGGVEGDILKVDEIVGVGDLILRGAAGNTSPVYIEGRDVIINNDGGSGNVQIGNAANPPYKLTIAGGGDIFGVDNNASLLAKNTAGAYESFMVPRDNTDKMKFRTGSAGLEIRDNGDANSRLFVSNSGTGNTGIGTANPGASLEVIAPSGNPPRVIRLRRNTPGSVDIFSATSNTNNSGDEKCQADGGSNAVCIVHWRIDTGAVIGCNNNSPSSGGRALCADLGD